MKKQLHNLCEDDFDMHSEHKDCGDVMDQNSVKDVQKSKDTSKLGNDSLNLQQSSLPILHERFNSSPMMILNQDSRNVDRQFYRLD